MSRRNIDSRGEKALGVFLDTYFYSEAQKNRIFEYVNRIYAKELQKKGVDIVIEEKKKIDEKAQLYYINRPVESFAFEIDYYDEKSDGIVDGWFVSEKNETDEYLLMWINKARTNHVNRLVAEDFEEVEADLINKQHIKAYIAKLGATDSFLKQKAIEMRDKKMRRYDICDSCHITYSFDKGNYSEKPINIVIDKKILDELSEQRYLISKEKVEVL